MDSVANLSREDETKNLLNSIHGAIDDPDAINEDPHMRKSLLVAARRLVTALEKPVETIFRFGWQVAPPDCHYQA